MLRYLKYSDDAGWQNYNTGSTDSNEVCRKFRYFAPTDDVRFYRVFLFSDVFDVSNDFCCFLQRFYIEVPRIHELRSPFPRSPRIARDPRAVTRRRGWSRVGFVSVGRSVDEERGSALT